MPTRRISTLVVLFAALSLCLACGEGPRASQADLGLLQPTPDPTLDAVVRSLPRMLAGAPPTSTPTPVPTRRVVANSTPAQRVKPQQKAQSPAPTATSAPPTATSAARPPTLAPTRVASPRPRP
jgi:hypothetical protein